MWKQIVSQYSNQMVEILNLQSIYRFYKTNNVPYPSDLIKILLVYKYIFPYKNKYIYI